jgi:hypothetical protein
VLGPGTTRLVPIAGSNGVPSTAIAVVLNVTATEPSTGGFLTVWPSGRSQPSTSNLNFLANETVPNMVAVGVGPDGAIDVANAFGLTHVIVDVMGYFESGFTGLSPARIMDTRAGLGGGEFTAAETRLLTVTDIAGVPSSASAVALNVTVTNPVLGGFLTVFPAGSPLPLSSNLNMQDGQTVANMVLVGVGVGGQIALYNDNGLTDVVVDVMGWFSADGGFAGLTPARVLDTRAVSCGATLLPGETRTLQIAGRGGAPSAGAGAVAVNVTATNASQQSFLTVWPTGQPRPNTSNLNMVAGRNVANMVAVGMGEGGQINIYNAGGTVDVIVDLMGYFSGDTQSGSIVPCPPRITIFGDGVHIVGQVMPPGRYVTSGGDFCYWARLRGFSGNLSDIISNDIGAGPRIVDIKPGDIGFESSHCGRWITYVGGLYSPKASFEDGIFAVGSQLLPGRYQSTGTDSCYWARLRGFGGELGDILDNDIGSGPRIVDIAASDTGIESSGCGAWTRIA